MLGANELAASITAAAISVSKTLNATDTALLSAIFVQLGDTLATIAAAKAKIGLLDASREGSTAAKALTEE